MRAEKSYRGISVRLAVHYLEGLGGDRVTDPAEVAAEFEDGILADRDGDRDGCRGSLASAADHDEDPYLPAAVVGDDWQATLDAEEVAIGGGAMTLHEVTVVFEGESERIEPLIERFSQKAIRAGG